MEAESLAWLQTVAVSVQDGTVIATCTQMHYSITITLEPEDVRYTEKFGIWEVASSFPIYG